MATETGFSFTVALTMVGCIILVLSAGVVPVAAVSVTASDIPQAAEPGEQITATLTVNRLYEPYEEWVLRGETDLDSARWTITARNQAGSQVDRTTFGGSSIPYDVDIATGISQLRIELSGTVPRQGGASTSFVFVQLRQEVSTVEDDVETVVVTTAQRTIIHTVYATSVEQEQSVIGTWRVDYTQSAPSTDAGQDEDISESTPREDSNGAAAEADVQRGFFVNDPNPDNPLSGLGSTHITAIGFFLSVVGILLELRGGS